LALVRAPLVADAANRPGLRIPSKGWLADCAHRWRGRSSGSVCPVQPHRMSQQRHRTKGAGVLRRSLLRMRAPRQWEWNAPASVKAVQVFEQLSDEAGSRPAGLQQMPRLVIVIGQAWNRVRSLTGKYRRCTHAGPSKSAGPKPGACI